VREVAEAEDRSVSSVIRRALAAYIAAAEEGRVVEPAKRRKA
jgi:predicted transcriptional regulator